MSTGKSPVVTGAGVKLIINGKVLGLATGISIQRSTGVKTVYEIDNPLPVEFIDTQYTVSGSLSGIRIIGFGGVEQNNIMSISSVQELLTRNYCSLQVVDRATGVTLYSVANVIFESDSVSFQPRSQTSFNANFRGMFVTTEKANGI